MLYIELIKSKKVSETKCLDYISQAKLVPNKSDKIFVFSTLLELLPFEKITGYASAKAELYNSIINELEGLSSHYEYV